jgi:hypothetical protein
MFGQDFIPHDFEIDLNNLVVANHNLTLEAINRSEEEDLEKLAPLGDPFDQTASHLLMFYEDLRRAAANLAVVGLVTRLDHWITRFCKEVRRKSKGLVSNLTLLNEDLGDGPVSVAFFCELVTVRDSVVHADSQEVWCYHDDLRRVAKHYTNDRGEVKLDEEQFKQAVVNAIEQVKWYDQKLREKQKQS